MAELPRLLYWRESAKARRKIKNVVFDRLKNDLNKLTTFTIKLVGSIKANTCIVDKDKNYDIDYQLLLNENLEP